MSGTPRFILERVAQAVAVIFAAYVFVFVVLTVLPGDPISNRLNDPEYNYTQEEIAKLVGYYGLDRPLHEQFLSTLWNGLRGDFGISLSTSAPVTDIIAQSLPSTLQLAFFALIFALLFAAIIAVLAVFAPWNGVRSLARSFPSLFLSLPNFLIGLVLIQVFSFQLGWFQTIRDEGLKSVILPSVTLAIPVSAPIAQIFVNSLDSTLRQQFVTIARAKGLKKRSIFLAHVLKPSSLPALTIIGVTIGELIGGSVITEAIFGRTGLGNVIERAVTDQDIPVLQGVVVLAAAAYVLINLLVDLSYPLLDARLRVRTHT